MGPGAGKEDPGHRPCLQHRHSWRSFTAVPLWAFLESAPTGFSDLPPSPASQTLQPTVCLKTDSEPYPLPIRTKPLALYERFPRSRARGSSLLAEA